MEQFSKKKIILELKMSEEKKIQITNWELVGIHWLAQVLANLFFGLSLVLLTLSYTGFSKEAIRTTSFLYIVIYCSIFVPFYGILPIFLFRRAKKVLGELNRGKKVEQEEIVQIIENLLDLPLKISVIVPITVWSGFTLGAFVLWRGLVPEFIPLIELIISCCMSIGFGVGTIHSFLNYIFLDNYLRPIIDYLGSFYSGPIRKIKIRKIPMAVKVFMVILLVALAAQVSLWAVLSAKIGVASLAELKSGLVYASIVSLLILAFVFVIAMLFSRNITYPLKKLIDWSGKIIEGETKEVISLITNDEILEVVENLKKMVRQLEESRAVLEIKVEARTKELRELAESLDEQVKERTEELEVKIKELEKFQEAAIGRELKMIELKKEIKKLEVKNKS